MKKLNLFILLMFGAIGTFASETQTIYLKPSNDWKSDAAKFGVYYWNESALNGFSDIMTLDEEGKYYLTEIPDAATSVIYIRLNPSATQPSFNNGIKWNQTQNLKLEDGNLCTITGWDEGEMSSYDPSAEIPTYTYTVQLKNAVCAGYEEVYLYAWDEEENHPLGDWPGTKIEAPYSHTFTESPALNLIWNDGGKHNKQTDNLLNIHVDTVFTLACQETYTYTVEMDYFGCSAWDALYLYAWGENDYKPLGDFPGTKLEAPYSYTFEDEVPLNLLWSNGTDEHKSKDFTNVHQNMHVYFPCGNNFTFSIKHLGCVEWEQIFVYAWDEEGEEPLGAFPGTEITSPYSLSFNNSAPLNFIVNDGTDKHKTDDILNVYSDYAYAFPCDKSFNFTVYNANCSGWENLYAYAWDSDGYEPLGAFPGWKLEYPYSIELTNQMALNFVLNDGTSENKTEDIKNIDEDYIYYFTCGDDPTAIGNTSTSNSSEVYKLINNNQILILRGEKVYTITGQEVR